MIALLGTSETDLYDWGDGDAAEAEGDMLVEDSRQPGYWQVAADLRAAILRGEYQAGDPLPPQAQLAARYGLDVAVINRAVAILVREGLATVGRGRRAVVLERRRYSTQVVLVWRSGKVPAGAFEAACDALDAAASADPLITDLEVGGKPDASRVLLAGMAVEAADPAQAVTRAFGIIRRALAAEGGWDLSAASVEARPADG